ncbi:MAG: TMEM165/GDT1 family protein [Eubacterium sp.]|nr:TMEM165/GDT1 family protein [Eubacterium sp.]
MLTFLSIFAAQFIAEMGDKTQIMLIALSTKYKLKDIILGTFVAILVLNAIGVLAGSFIGSVIPEYIIKLVAGIVFVIFAITYLFPSKDNEEDAKESKISFAPLAVFFTFFIAELGDKTQLTAITFGANAGLSNALVVWLACSLGLFAADMLGLFFGKIISSKVPEKTINIVAAVIFLIFGILTLYRAFKAYV